LDYYIHGGLTKTGSTSIQQFLGANAGPLGQRGVYYPVGYLDIHRRQHSPLAGALTEGRPEEVEAFARQSREGAEAAGASKVVWSGESIGNLRPEHMGELLRIAREQGGARDIKIIYYHRNLYDRLVSRLNQQTKMRESIVDDAFITRLNKGSPSDQIRAWEETAGADKVDIRIFDLAIRTGLEKDFLEAIGVEWSDEYVIPPPVNSSLDPITAQVLNLLRVEWGLPGGLVRNCERRSHNYRLPVLRARTMELLHKAVAETDLSHPKLAPHREVLTRFKAPDPTAKPPLPEFIDDLIGTLTYIRDGVAAAADTDKPRRRKAETVD
jgi:hypothetical protein